MVLKEHVNVTVIMLELMKRPGTNATSFPGSLLLLGETLAAAGHVPPREVNLIVTVRGVGKERVCT